MYMNFELGDDGMIRQAKAAELKQCAELIQTSFLTVADKFEITRENAPDFTAFAVTEEVLRMQLADSNRKLYAYIEDEEIVGYYSLLFMENYTYELNHLCVHPEHRHKKIGEKLLLDAFENAKNAGAIKMCIGIVEENTVLRKWYEAHGFIHTGTEKFDFFPFTCGYMEKML